MIEQGRDKNSQNDGKRFAKARRQNDGEQLRLVADLSERNDASGNQESFHQQLQGRKRNDHRTPGPTPE